MAAMSDYNCNSGDSRSKGNTKLSHNGPTQEELSAFERDIVQLQQIYGNLHDPSLSFIRNLFFKGKYEPINFDGPPNDKPEWLDTEKFNRGRKFALDNTLGLVLAEFTSLILIFAINQSLGALIFTHASDSPFKCFKRYESTFKRLRTWYQEELWSEESNDAKMNLLAVRAMHKNVHIAMSSCSEKQLQTKISLGNPNELEAKFNFYRVIKEDAEGFSSFTPETQIQEHTKIWFNQMTTAFVQWAFAGLIVIYPKNFGVHHADDEDLEAFAYMWKVLGYMLGLKDEFNFCEGDLETVRERSKLITYIIMPYFKRITPEWEHMSRCLIDGGNFVMNGLVTFEGIILYMFHVLKVKTPKISESLNFWQSFNYYSMMYTYEYLMKIPFLSKLFNSLMLKNIDRVQNASDELLKRWEEKEHFYVKNKERAEIGEQS